METRANYIVIGLFTLATIFGAFAFVYWFENMAGASARTNYGVVFGGPVAGLRKGSSVTFNGLRVGEVARIELDRDNPSRVVATVSVDSATPVRADTTVALEFQGVTGLAALAMRGGSPQSGPPPAGPTGMATLLADSAQSRDAVEQARTVLRRFDGLLAENEEALKNTVRNMETFSDTLAKNSERIERILIGVETLTAGKGTVAEAVESLKALANAGMRDLNALASDGRRAINTVEQVIRNIDRNPSRLLFGGASPQPIEPPRNRGTQR